MSEENVELIRGIGERWSAGDFTSTGWAHPEIVFRTPEALGQRQVQGIEEMTLEWTSWLHTFDGFTSEFERVFDAGDQVVVFVRFGGTAKASGLPMSEIPGCSRFLIRDGKVVELEIGTDRKQALRDAGLSPDLA
jgi:ketosteroid isomerase-like protein